MSLVPSLTEALFALGLGDRVVGVTDWCVHPAAELARLQRLARLARVGGTKTPDRDAIRRLRPDLVIANREENRRRDVERLRADGIRVWVTYPRTVAEGARLLREVAALGADSAAVRAVVEPAEAAVARAAARERPRRARVFCPIWKRPWMAVGRDTYMHDLLVLCGGRNVFGEREGGRRYPLVSLDEVVAAAPEVILLPDEPYAFDEGDAAELRALPVPAAERDRIHCLDGTLLSWYGPRIARAVGEVERLLAPEPEGLKT